MATEQDAALRKQMPWLYGAADQENYKEFSNSDKSIAWGNYEKAKAFIASGSYTKEEAFAKA
jgi:hypothetical protein